MYDIDSTVETVVNPELYGGETLLWAARPSMMRVIQKNAIALIGPLMMLGVLLFILPRFMGFSVFSFGFGSSFSFIFVIILLIMLGSMAVPIWSLFSEARAVYAITDQRALIITPGLSGRSVKSYSASDIQRIERHGSDTGDIIFGYETRYRRSRYGSRAYSVGIGFYGIPNVRAVELLLLETFKMPGGEKAKPKRDEAGYDDNYDEYEARRNR